MFAKGKITQSLSCAAVFRADSVLQELKQATSPDHQRLELLSGIQQSLRSLPEYRLLLVKMCGIYLALETRLRLVEELPSYLPDLSDRWKIGSLVSDLRSLAIPIQTVPHCSPVPAILSVPQAFGCMYVLEGSTLGGQILSREILTHLKLTPTHGCRFFSSYNSNVGPMWRQFTHALEGYATAHPDERPTIVESAVATFRFFSRCLIDEQSHPVIDRQERAHYSVGPA